MYIYYKLKFGAFVGNLQTYQVNNHKEKDFKSIALNTKIENIEIDIGSNSNSKIDLELVNDYVKNYMKHFK